MRYFILTLTGYRLMVRTLDFHFKNVGSNPASPIIYNINTNLDKKNTLKFKLTFVSLINPFIISNISYDNYLRTTISKKNNINKLYVKQSYMLLTWFYYLSFLQTKDSLSTNVDKNAIKIFILPKKKKIFTSTKAPIAHKTRSKEQFSFSFFTFKISTFFFFKKNHSLSSNLTLYILLITKNFMSCSETNLFFLKNLKTMVNFYDPSFFTYLK